MKSICVVQGSKQSNTRTAAVFIDECLYVVHFRVDGVRTRTSDQKPYQYCTKDKTMALWVARDFVKHGE